LSQGYEKLHVNFSLFYSSLILKSWREKLYGMWALIPSNMHDWMTASVKFRCEFSMGIFNHSLGAFFMVQFEHWQFPMEIFVFSNFSYFTMKFRYKLLIVWLFCLIFTMDMTENYYFSIFRSFRYEFLMKIQKSQIFYSLLVI
jgi:hypothetical protein